MGTDISYLAEKRVGDHWEPAFDTYLGAGDPDEPRILSHENQFYFAGDRNYELYQILAWTADEKTGLTSRGFEPISPPRGYPADLSDAVRETMGDPAEESPDCFGHSWLLLQELIDFPWQEKKRTIVGLVDVENYPLFKCGNPYQMQQISPRYPKHCKGSKGRPEPAEKIISNQEMERWINSESFDDADALQVALQRMDAGLKPERRRNPRDDLWTQIEYQQSYTVAGHGILIDTIPKLSKVGPSDQVRVVFNFWC
jgi:hypothetical protein